MNTLNLSELTGVKRELARRFIVQAGNNPEPVNSLVTNLDWLEILEDIPTETAFNRAEAGEDVFMVYEDGTDNMLDDIEVEREYYKVNGKYDSYPDIETIFVQEKTGRQNYE